MTRPERAGFAVPAAQRACKRAHAGRGLLVLFKLHDLVGAAVAAQIWPHPPPGRRARAGARPGKGTACPCVTSNVNFARAQRAAAVAGIRPPNRRCLASWPQSGVGCRGEATISQNADRISASSAGDSPAAAALHALRGRARRSRTRTPAAGSRPLTRAQSKVGLQCWMHYRVGRCPASTVSPAPVMGASRCPPAPVRDAPPARPGGSPAPTLRQNPDRAAPSPTRTFLRAFPRAQPSRPSPSGT